MKTTRALLALSLAALALTPSFARADVTRTESEDYVGGSLAGLCRQESGEDVNLTTVCFQVDPNEDHNVVLTAIDVASPSVAFTYLIHTSAGECANGTLTNCRSAGTRCGSSEALPIPETATGVRVQVLDPVIGSISCPSQRISAAVAGTLTAQFSD